ncbi:MAG TPA: hypothetical protein VK611_19670 [Acidimicrobiales bacterium]|nr:hypothetical protein [Acidimicrobiales bacterium]
MEEVLPQLDEVTTAERAVAMGLDDLGHVEDQAHREAAGGRWGRIAGFLYGVAVHVGE